MCQIQEAIDEVVRLQFEAIQGLNIRGAEKLNRIAWKLQRDYSKQHRVIHRGFTCEKCQKPILRDTQASDIQGAILCDICMVKMGAELSPSLDGWIVSNNFQHNFYILTGHTLPGSKFAPQHRFEQLEVGQEFMFFSEPWDDSIIIKISETEANLKIFGRSTSFPVHPRCTVFPISREIDYPEPHSMYAVLLD